MFTYKLSQHAIVIEALLITAVSHDRGMRVCDVTSGTHASSDRGNYNNDVQHVHEHEGNVFVCIHVLKLAEDTWKSLQWFASRLESG